MKRYVEIFPDTEQITSSLSKPYPIELGGTKLSPSSNIVKILNKAISKSSA